MFGNAVQETPATWSDRISSAKVGKNAILIGYQHAGYKGASIKLNGGTGYPLFLDLGHGLPAGANWNDRISALKIVRAPGTGDAQLDLSHPDNQVVLWEDSRYENGRMTLAIGREIPDLAEFTPEGTRAAALEVHEWGTFTVLQGSDGHVIQWYQAPDKIVDLPPFVRFNPYVRGKIATGNWASAGLDTIRMETPVLYFYPEEEMDVTVSATFPDGRITEVFPPPFGVSATETIWSGTLLPPDSPQREKNPRRHRPGRSPLRRRARRPGSVVVPRQGRSPNRRRKGPAGYAADRVSRVQKNPRRKRSNPSTTSSSTAARGTAQSSGSTRYRETAQTPTR